MRYPSLNRASRRRVIIPQLSGGVNVTESPSYVGDNQLTECNNMYFDRGKLRTRPGFEHKSTLPFNPTEFVQTGSTGWMFDDQFITDDDYAYPNIFAVSEQEGRLSFAEEVNSSAGSDMVLNIPFRSSDETTVLRLQGERQGDGIYVRAITSRFDGEISVEYNDDIYIPTVLINNNGSTSPDSCELSGTLLEGYNMINDSYKMLATANGIAMAWKLPRQLQGGEVITVELYDSVKGKITHKIITDWNIDRSADYSFSRYVSNAVTATYIRDGATEPTEYQQKVAYDAYTNCIVFVAMDEGLNETEFGMHIGPLSVGAYSNSSSNMCITVENMKSSRAETILKMTKACWFGGSRGGLGGGTRLFLSGNPDCPGAVYWSDLNNPTYFPENNYAYVGDSSEITAMAQQSDLMVIFQNNAITVSEYVQGDTVSADDLTSGAVVDITTLVATFPMTPLHSSVGCDCPDSLRLCANRLVWLNSDGKVYTLVSYGQYNERNVREVSYLIEPLLKQHSVQSLKKAKSADISGKYCLFIDNKVYVLDYDSGAFKSYTAYSGDRQAQKNIAWYVWTLPEFMSSIEQVFSLDTVAAVITDDNSIYSLCFDGQQTATVDFDGNNEHPVPCFFVTKHFIFGAPDRMKSVDSLMLTLGKTEGEVYIDCISDGEVLSTSQVCCDENNDDLLHRQRVFPCANNVTDFYIKVGSDQKLSVEGITIIYKETGETM